ncbi:uncharacterized protein LOC108683177 [Hyalella azteca]|uniref:Uncharacterized protein LOC108683177 n=1 Tax=Hyalella azteca TaxID=294128 RepID=A0A8B7PR57_HYAAZ|nr:uncharacterized protein LOC108683177 [Hyalella azteca]
MSKLVGGTSTPFPASLTSAPAASISAIPINLAASKNSHRRDERREPETVSDQIKVCFGFDESDNDEAESCGYEPASFNLSPVRREQGSFWPPSHYSSMLSEAEDGIPRAHHSVTDNRSMKSNVSSCGTFLKPPVVRRTCVPARLTAATSGLAAKVTSSISQRPVAPISNPSRQISALSSHIEGNSITTETNASANAIESRNVEKDPSSTKNHNVVKTAKIKSKDRENGGFSSNIGVDATSNTAGLEESRLFDEEDLSPAKEASPVKATAENAAASTVVSPEKSFSEPVRRAYDRRSLETSRRSLLVSLAGGPPDDDEDNMADQEDVSSASVTRRRKRKTAATDAKTRPMKALKSRSAKQPAIGKSRAEAEVDSTLEESVALPSVKLPKKSTLKSATRTLSSRTKAKKRPSDDSDKGHTNKKVKPDSILSTDKKTGTGKSVAFETSSDQSGASFGDSSNASANSAHGKKHKRPTKAAAFEKSLNDWASDLNSHFSEVEDLELVVA